SRSRSGTSSSEKRIVPDARNCIPGGIAGVGDEDWIESDMADASAGVDPFRVFGFREINSSVFRLYFRRTEACFIPRPNYFVALPARKYSRRPGPDLCRANPRMEMPLSLVMAAIGAIARS